MDADTLMFFEQQPDALPLYEAFSEAVLKRYPDTKIKVQKTQITFTNRHIFACASFLRVRKKKELPNPYLVITLGFPKVKETIYILTLTLLPIQKTKDLLEVLLWLRT